MIWSSRRRQFISIEGLVCRRTYSIFPNKWSCGTVSKALEKSEIAMSTWILWSRKVKRSWSVSNSCVSQENFDLNPWLKGVRIPCLSKWVRKSLTMMCSKILHNTRQGDGSVVLWHTLCPLLEDRGNESLSPWRGNRSTTETLCHSANLETSQWGHKRRIHLNCVQKEFLHTLFPDSSVQVEQGVQHAWSEQPCS